MGAGTSGFRFSCFDRLSALEPHRLGTGSDGTKKRSLRVLCARAMLRDVSEPGKMPRFPFVAAALCAACVGVAGWMWMRYSYAWDVTVKRLMAGDASCPASSLQQLEIGRWVGTYVRVHDFVADNQRMGEPWGFSSGRSHTVRRA